MESRNPQKHLVVISLTELHRVAARCVLGDTNQAASAVSRVKSAIIDRKDRKTKLSDNKLNASRGTSTGAPIARTSRACWPGSGCPVFQPYILNIKYIQ